jgi:molybdopterin molybdotransferase
MGCDVSGVEIVRDDPVILRAAVSKALDRSDLVLLSGGVSVGDHDHVREVLAGLGVEELFWRVRQKPGKPMYAGFKGDKPVIGLPGNPYATFVGFMMYARPALFLLMGADRPDLRKLTLPAASDIRRDPERAQWLKGRLISTGGECRAEPLGRQASHLLSSLKDADVLILIPEGLNVLKKGEIVEAYELPS